ncbi:MAG: spermidine synthase [Candidatus Dactylopiibacterium carminicum]|uniref:Polyamine aminopropyltransferase n=2 Tax=Candidatus Dactylopiibacterium carminicum TaxID=857335 RepID=A0A272F0B2_9RHOO|nr:spermidine synthase [Candidatus Dactylopiibacterium carminicum]PAS95310.1 MAG: spermidine synthase [Candidatus Dactylopiibacterium carminicum]
MRFMNQSSLSMETCFLGQHLPGWQLRLNGRCLARGCSAYQAWEVWESDRLGRLYALDGRAMASEADAFLCHEPLVHMPGLAHAGPRRALVLGGGDGASARELLRYPGMEEVVIAELDAAVIDLTREYLPSLHQGALDDPRVSVKLGDAAVTLEQLAVADERFDLLVYDLTDPDTSAASLFRREAFAAGKALLRADGALCMQLGLPLGQPAQIRALLASLREVFTLVTPFFTPVPLYGGLWAMACAADHVAPGGMPTDLLAARIAALNGPPLQALDAASYPALLALPPWLAGLTNG